MFEKLKKRMKNSGKANEWALRMEILFFRILALHYRNSIFSSFLWMDARNGRKLLFLRKIFVEFSSVSASPKDALHLFLFFVALKNSSITAKKWDEKRGKKE